MTTIIIPVFRKLNHQDSAITIRVNKDLKREFSQLCDANHLSVSTALKQYMAQCVEKGKIIK